MSIDIKIVKDFSGFPTDVTIKQNGRKAELKVVNDSNFIVKGTPTADMWHALSMVFNDVRSHKGAANWYDRNPRTIHRAYNAYLVGHVATERWTYTVPANRKCLIESLQLLVFCDVAVIGTLSYFDVYYTPFGEADQAIFGAVIMNDTRGQIANPSNSQSFLMFAGDVVHALSTSQAGVGGGNVMAAYLKGTEFDA